MVRGFEKFSLVNLLLMSERADSFIWWSSKLKAFVVTRWSESKFRCAVTGRPVECESRFEKAVCCFLAMAVTASCWLCSIVPPTLVLVILVLGISR